MYSHSDSRFFDTFLCADPECQEQNLNENTLLNCFHTVCNTHLQNNELVNCPNQECTYELDTGPALDRWKNPISCHIGKQLSGLKATRMVGNKCQMCSHVEGIVFCIECCSAWCDEHRKSIHSKFDRGHRFVELSANGNEEFIKEVLRNLNVPMGRVNDELNHLIESLESRKDSMSINLVRFENGLKEFQDNTMRITEEAERDFDRIKKLIEQIREENLEKLRAKSEEFARELEEKIHILSFKVEATDRALKIAQCVKSARLNPDQKFVQLLKESNSLQLNDRLSEMSDSPREHHKVPRVVKKINRELMRLSSVQGCVANLRFIKNVKYSLGTETTRYDIDQCINQPVCHGTRIHIYFEFVLAQNPGKTTVTIYHSDQSKKFIPSPPQEFPIRRRTDGYVLQFQAFQPENAIVTKISIEGLSQDSESFSIFVCDTAQKMCKENKSLSTLRIEPGHLTSLAKSRNKVFAICKDANHIRRYDARPQAISADPELEETSPPVWNSEVTFGVGHLIEPRGICVFQSILFVTDCYHHAVLCFTTDGSFISKFGSRGSGKRQFESPMGMAVDQDNDRLIIADNGNNRIQILLLASYQDGWESFQAKGEIELKGRPVDVKLDILGAIFVLTHSGEILRYDRSYILSGSILYCDSICPLMPFFAIDFDEVIYICSVKGTVYMISEIEYEPDKYNLQRHPTFPKELNLSGLTVDENGKLFIAHNDPPEATGPTRSLVYVSNRF